MKKWGQNHFIVFNWQDIQGIKCRLPCSLQTSQANKWNKTKCLVTNVEWHVLNQYLRVFNQVQVHSKWVNMTSYSKHNKRFSSTLNLSEQVVTQRNVIYCGIGSFLKSLCITVTSPSIVSKEKRSSTSTKPSNSQLHKSSNTPKRTHPPTRTHSRTHTPTHTHAPHTRSRAAPDL